MLASITHLRVPDSTRNNPYRAIDVCRNGKATRRQNALHHLGGTDAGDAIAVTARA